METKNCTLICGAKCRRSQSCLAICRNTVWCHRTRWGQDRDMGIVKRNGKHGLDMVIVDLKAVMSLPSVPSVPFVLSVPSVHARPVHGKVKKRGRNEPRFSSRWHHSTASFKHSSSFSFGTRGGARKSAKFCLREAESSC